MRIVLIQPPIEDFYSTAVRLQPIGLAYLKAAIKQNFGEVDVVVRDYHYGYGKRTIPWPKELAFLKAFYPFADRSPFSTFYQYYHFGAPYEVIVREVAELNPDVVGISVLFSAYAPQAFKLAADLKKALKVPILLGGSHVSAEAQRTLALPFVDFVIYGEGERPIVAFVEEMLGKRNWSNVPNLGFKQNGRLVFNGVQENFALDEIPFPDFSDLNAQHYRHGSRKLSFIISSRSCPYRCRFCSVHQTFGKVFRQRSVPNILAELSLRREQGYTAFDFEDDNLTFDRKRILRLLHEFEAGFSGEDVRFMAMNGVAYFRLDKEILALMRRVGFRDLNISLVSRNEKLLRALKRPFHFSKFEEMVSLAESLDMQVVSYQILGLPGDTAEGMLETLIYQSRLPVIIGVSPFYYTKGMPLAEQSFMEKPYWVLGRLTSLGIGKDAHEREVIYTLFILARMVNFLKNISGIERDVHLADLLVEESSGNGRVRLGLDVLKRLFVEKRLFGFTGKDFKPLAKFRFDIFKAFVQQVRFIKQPGGGVIRVDGLL